MSIIVTSNHTRVRAWVNIKMKGRDPLLVYYTLLYTTIINCPAGISHTPRRHGKLGLQLSLKENQKRTLVIKKKSGHMVFKRVPHW